MTLDPRMGKEMGRVEEKKTGRGDERRVEERGMRECRKNNHKMEHIIVTAEGAAGPPRHIVLDSRTTLP